MELRPILSTLRRHKTAALLIVFEVAITSAIVCNALHLIASRLVMLNQDSGLPEAELLVADIRGTGGPANVDDITRQDLQQFRALPGVKSAAVVNQMVYGSSSNNSGVTLDPADKNSPLEATQYYVGEHGLQTMGLKLVAGRDFLPEEYIAGHSFNQMAKPVVGQVIINRTMATRLWPGQSAIGKTMYVFDDSPSTVIGVVETLSHPYPGRAPNKDGLAMMFPIRPSYRGGAYLLRVQPAQMDAVMRALPGVIERIDGTRIVSGVKPMLEMRAKYYAQDRSMVWLMGGVIVALLVVTAFGIVGLVSFWVQQRTRMIGTRRALGATRAQIQHYFQLENFMLSSAGIVLGMAGAYGLSLLLMVNYELARLPWSYLPIGAVVLWLLGQAAVLAPARRAAALAPVAALRS